MLKIALVSYEFPIDTYFGGIATYVYQAAKMLSEMGEYVEVFTGTDKINRFQMMDNIRVNLIKTRRETFAEDVLKSFSDRHKFINFSIIESPDYRGDGYYIKQKYPEVPLVIKFHTPDFLIRDIYNKVSKNNFFSFSTEKYRRIFNARFNPNAFNYIDFKQSQIANGFSSPSIDLAKIIHLNWNINKKNIKIIPYPYIPSKNLLEINSYRKPRVITFFGRIEYRKGVLDIASAIPEVLEEFPNCIFQFVGKMTYLDSRKYDEVIYKMCPRNTESIKFLEHKSQTELAKILSETDICLLPSIFDNFPNTCLEAMSAGRAVIAGNYGGMREMIQNGYNGLLVKPHSPKQIVKKLKLLLNDENMCKVFGLNARKKILTNYSSSEIYPKTINFYNEVITNTYQPKTGIL